MWVLMTILFKSMRRVKSLFRIKRAWRKNTRTKKPCSPLIMLKILNKGSPNLPVAIITTHSLRHLIFLNLMPRMTLKWAIIKDRTKTMAKSPNTLRLDSSTLIYSASDLSSILTSTTLMLSSIPKLLSPSPLQSSNMVNRMLLLARWKCNLKSLVMPFC